MEIFRLILGPSVTLIVGVIALIIYKLQKNDSKRDAAKIIIQEIRRAEQIISDYRQTGQYRFSKKIIATNSWGKNLHYFVGYLNNDELDKISDLYSTGEYLDNLINDVSQITFQKMIDDDKEIQKAIAANQPINIPPLNPVWKFRLDDISIKLELIYHSTIVGKLKEIAKIK